MLRIHIKMALQSACEVMITQIWLFYSFTLFFYRTTNIVRCNDFSKNLWHSFLFPSFRHLRLYNKVPFLLFLVKIIPKPKLQKTQNHDFGVFKCTTLLAQKFGYKFIRTDAIKCCKQDLDAFVTWALIA